MKKVDVKKIVNSVKSARSQFEILLKNRKWVTNAKKYAQKQGNEVKKLLKADVAKIKSFLEKERKQLENFQKQIPSEVEKIKKFLTGQQNELTKMLRNVKAVKSPARKKTKATGSAKKRTKKPASSNS